MTYITYNISCIDNGDGTYSALSVAPDTLVSTTDDIYLQVCAKGWYNLHDITASITDETGATKTTHITASSVYRGIYTALLDDILPDDSTTDSLYRYTITFTLRARASSDTDPIIDYVATDKFRVYDTDTYTSYSPSDLDMIYRTLNNQNSKINALATKIAELEAE